MSPSAQKQNNFLAIGALLLGATAIATSALFVKVSEAGPVATAFWRIFLALPLLWLWSLYGQRERHAQSFSEQRGLMIAAGFCFAGDLAFWHWSIVLTSVANSTLLDNTVTITNNSGSDVNDVFYGRSVDPDNCASHNDNYDTNNVVVSQVGVDGAKHGIDGVCTDLMATFDEVDELVDHVFCLGDTSVVTLESQLVATQPNRAVEPGSKRVEDAVVDSRELRGNSVRHVDNLLHCCSVGRRPGGTAAPLRRAFRGRAG